MPYNIIGECRNTGRTHFKKEVVPWNKGKSGIYSAKTLFNIGSSRRGKLSPMSGKHHTEETKDKIRKHIHITLIGNTRTKGKPWSENRRKAQLLVPKKPKTKPVKLNGKEYHPLWHELRKLVYKRDNWICQECGRHCGRKLGIACHHIDYDISNNDLSNLVTLCVRCHAKTNFKREDWIIHYKNKEMRATSHF